MIYDVEDTENDTDIVDDIYEQNVKDKIEFDIFNKDFNIVHKYKKRGVNDNRVTVVVECSAGVRNVIRQHDRLYIGWQSCRIKDFNPIVRCFRCQCYGHVAKYCKNKNMCPHCAECHELKDCPNKAKPPKCGNCIVQKRDANHAISNSKCPEYVRATKIAHEEIDYGT